MTVEPNLYEARFSGAFDVDDADAEAVNFRGRYVYIVIADYTQEALKENAKGDTILTITLKPVDVALVRTQEMKNSLIEQFHLQGLEPQLPGFEFDRLKELDDSLTGLDPELEFKLDEEEVFTPSSSTAQVLPSPVLNGSEPGPRDPVLSRFLEEATQ